MEDINKQYREFLYRFFLKHVKVHALAEDLAQDVFIKFWQRKDHADSIENINAWLYTLARNRLMDHYRKLASEKKYQDLIWYEMEQHSNDVIQEIYKNELDEKIGALLKSLPPRQIEVYRLSRENGLSLDEVAKTLDISPNTAKNHLVQALKVLRIALKSSYVLFLFSIN
ncbi:RNA polymerase sigma factor [Dyadobacter sp. CY323]|uniref:RNA polymerase sigma factor n=1 Tax=Dyadobacter sp. CY323 TaxID=2907302 RepID=UPI001F486ACB|nr:sigma-70 family RNA polymerase sigma factor [Dyadobacter sp. CY323]MCE6989830.1 sigma-70 family RNA polymerase sigma factor [Dyadobacter sp. CY323]